MTTTTDSATTAADSGTDVPAWPMLIGGRHVAAVDGEWIDVVSAGERSVTLARVPRGRDADADRAVQAASSAFPAWRALHFLPAAQKSHIRIDMTVDQIKATPEFKPVSRALDPPTVMAAPPPSPGIPALGK